MNKMKNHYSTLFWILTDILLIFAIPFFPSFFSIFCILTAIILAPIDIWQETLNKHLKKPIKPIVIAIVVAFVFALFPITPIITGIVRLSNPDTYAPKNTSSVVYYEEEFKPSVSSDASVSSNLCDSNNDFNFSSEYAIDEQTSTTSTNEKFTNNTTSKISNNSSKTSSKYSPQKQNNSSESTRSSSNYKSEQNDLKNNQESNSNTVYRTPSGKRYHKSETCGGKNSYAVSLDEAKTSGLTECQRCYK